MQHACNRCIRRYAAQALVDGRRMTAEDIKPAEHEVHSPLYLKAPTHNFCMVDFLCEQCLTQTIDYGETSLHADGVILELGEQCPYGATNV